MSNNQSAGAIWTKTINTKNGEVEILNIVIGDKKYVAWPNSYKQPGEKSPDYRIQEDNYKPEPKAEAAPKKSFAGQDDLPF